MNGVVGPLEETELGVLDELERRIMALRIQALQLAARHGHTRRDVIFHLQLESRDVVLAKAEGAPGIVVVIAHAQELGDQTLAAQPQFVGRRSVDHIDAETGSPILAPGGLPEPLHYQNQFADVRGNGADPRVVLL